MANILGIKGFNQSVGGVNKLLAAFGNDVVDISSGTGYKLNLTSTNNVEFEVFMDNVFIQNGLDRPRNFDGTSWKTNLCEKMPIAKYIKKFKDRLFVANCTIPYVTSEGGTHLWDEDPMEVRYTSSSLVQARSTFPSRVFFSDLPKSRTELTWGLYWSREWGSTPKTDTLTNQIKLEAAKKKTFLSTNLKVGDPFTLVDFANSVTQFSTDTVFRISEIDSHFRLNLTNETTGIRGDTSGWAGSNWFDVGTDDGDVITGMGENSDRLLIFKLMTLWYYTGTQLRQVKDALGTSSHRSIINKGGYTYYFHGSDPDLAGIYRFDGVSSVKVSRGIDPYIRGMSTGNYDDVVAWEEGEELRFFIGDVSNSNFDISMSNAVATLHTATNAWDVSPIADVVTAATTYRTSNRRDTYIGTSDSQVMKMSSGNSHNGTPIRLNVETKTRYPSGSDVINEFTRLQVIGRKLQGMQAKYKMVNNPTGVDDQWQSFVGELNDDKNELRFKQGHNVGSGYKLQFGELGSLENDVYVEKSTAFYRPQRVRVLGKD